MNTERDVDDVLGGKTTQAIENLLIYASAKGLIETVDMPYFRNLLLDAFQLDAPAGDIVPMADVPPTATALLRALCDLAVEKASSRT